MEIKYKTSSMYKRHCMTLMILQNMRDFVITTVPADALPPIGAKAFASGPVTANFGSQRMTGW